MELSDVFFKRRSVRRYNGSEVDSEEIRSIIKAGLLAPSSRNLKSAEFLIVKDKELIHQLARAKTAGSGMLKDASCAVVVIGDSVKSDAWIEDCSIAMTYMMLKATEIGVANCWVQCRGRISQQKAGESFSEKTEDIALTAEESSSEALVAQRIADSSHDTDNLSSNDFIKLLLKIPDKYSVLAVLALGKSDIYPGPHSLNSEDLSRVHEIDSSLWKY